MGTSTNNATIVSRATQRIAALQKHVSGKADISIAGTKMKGSALVALFQNTLDTGGDVTATKGAYKLALSARADAEAQAKVADESLKSWVLITYGADSQEAHDFGYVPKVRATKTVETKANAIALGKATREARGTKGPKAKLKIKGTLPAVAAPPPTPLQMAAPVPQLVAAPVAAPASTPAPLATH